MLQRLTNYCQQRTQIGQFVRATFLTSQNGYINYLDARLEPYNDIYYSMGYTGVIEYSVISNQDLDKLVKNFVDEFPCAGMKTLAGYLHSQSYCIQR